MTAIIIYCCHHYVLKVWTGSAGILQLSAWSVSSGQVSCYAVWLRTGSNETWCATVLRRALGKLRHSV